MNKSKVLRRTTDGRYVWKRAGKYKLKNRRLLVNYNSPTPTFPSPKNVPDICSRGTVDTIDSDESDILEDNVNKLLNPNECKFRRPINFFNKVEQNPPKLRRSIVTRALQQNVISSTPMPSKQIRNFINTDISLDLSPIDGHDEHIPNDDGMQEHKTLTNIVKESKSKCTVITISDSENIENDNLENNNTKKNTSMRLEEPQVMKNLSTRRNNCNDKENSKVDANNSQRKTGKPIKLSNSFTQSVLWTNKLRNSDCKLESSRNVTLVENQMKTNSKLDLYFDKKMNSDTKNNKSLTKSNTKVPESQLSPKKLSFSSISTEGENPNFQGLVCKDPSIPIINGGLTTEKTNTRRSIDSNEELKQLKKKPVPPKPAPRKRLPTRQRELSKIKPKVSIEKIFTDIATSPCDLIVQQHELLHASIDKRLNNSVTSNSKLNGTRIPPSYMGDINNEDIAKTMTNIASSPYSFRKKQNGLLKESKSMQKYVGQVAKTITSDGESHYESDKEVESNYIQVSKNELNFVDQGKSNNNSKLKDHANNSIKTHISIGTSVQNNGLKNSSNLNFVDQGKSKNNSKLKDHVNNSITTHMSIGTSLQNNSIKQAKMERLNKLIFNLPKIKNMEDSSNSESEVNGKMICKEIQTSTKGLLDPFKHFGRNISTQTIAEQYGRSFKLQEVDNRSDCTNESNLLNEIDNDLLFRTVPPESNFSSFMSNDKYSYMFEDSNKKCPWRLSGDFIPLSEPPVRLNFLKSSIDIGSRKSESLKKDKGSRKKKINKFRQYSRKPSRYRSRRNTRSSLATSFSSSLTKTTTKTSLTNSVNNGNGSNVTSTNNIPDQEVSDLLGNGSTVNERQANELVNSIQHVQTVKATSELYVNIEKTSITPKENLEQSQHNPLSPKLDNKHMKRCSIRKNMSLQFSEEDKEKKNERAPGILHDKSLNQGVAIVPSPATDTLSKANNNDFRNFEDLAKPLDESLTDREIPIKVNNTNCDMEQESVKKCNEVSKVYATRSTLKSTSKNCDVSSNMNQADTTSNLDFNPEIRGELLEKCEDVPVFKYPKKRGRKLKSGNVSNSCVSISNIRLADTTTGLDSGCSTAVRRSGRERKPVKHLTETGVLVTHSQRDLNYWDVQRKTEDTQRKTLQFSITKTNRKVKSKLTEVSGRPEKISKSKLNKKLSITTDECAQESTQVTATDEVTSTNKELTIQNCKPALRGSKNLEIPSCSNIRTEISYENQRYSTLNNENIDQAENSQSNNVQITVDSGRSTLLTFEEYLHSTQKTGKVNKDHKPKSKISNKISKILSRSTVHSGQIEYADGQCGIDVENDKNHSIRKKTLLQSKCKETDYVKVLVNDEVVDLQYVHKDHTFVHEYNNIMMTDSLKKSNYPIVGGYLKLPPGGKKFLHIPKSHSLFYFVTSGEGHVQVHNSLSKVQKMDHFIIPVGIAYSIFNDSLEEPLLLNCVKISVPSH